MTDELKPDKLAIEAFLAAAFGDEPYALISGNTDAEEISIHTNLGDFSLQALLTAAASAHATGMGLKHIHDA